MSINRVIISGNLSRDPDLRQTSGGTMVLGFGVAVNDRRRNPQTGEWEDFPNWVDCVVFGKRAESLSDMLRKGMKVAIEGKLRYSAWEAKDGQKRSKIEVAVDELELMQQRQQPAAAYPPAPAYQQAPAYQPQPQEQPPMRQAPAMDVYDGDIPFQ